jgi:hypothetical protein
VFTGLTLSFPTPSDGSVTDAKIVDMAASKLTGTIADARFPATLPAASGVNLTALNATNLGSGTVPTARLGTGTASSSTFLRGDQTYAEAGGGKMLQCLNAVTNTQGSTTSTSFIDSPLTLAITPSATSSKILVVTTFYYGGAHYTSSGPHVGLFRDSTQLSTDIVTGHDSANYSGDAGQAASFSYLDSPSSTSSLTFKLKYLTEGSTAYFNRGANTNWGGGTSSITLMEISA